MTLTETRHLAEAAAFNIAATAASPALKHLVPRESGYLAARFLEDKPGFRFWLEMLKRPAFHPWFRRYQALTIPGMALHQALRKLSLEEAAIHGLEAGIDQMVILGGGFDTLAARLARRYPRARFFELDTPSMTSAKHHALERTDFLSPNLSLAALDPKRLEMKAVLSLPGFDPGAPAFFLCESTLMRMERGMVDKLFAGLAALPCPVVRFAFTVMEPDGRGEIAFRAARRGLASWLWRGKKAYKWGITARELGAFLARRGFALEEVADTEVFRSRFLAGLPEASLPEGEMVAIASVRAR